MPPKPIGKPKGLKASKRAAPVQPTATAGPALNKEGTMPLDEDALTVADLFELAYRVVDILYPLPTSLRFEPTDPETGIDDARNLLRGVLHGCDVLEPYVDSPRRSDMDQDKLDALGLGSAVLARGYLRYLQAFALRLLGELFEPAPSPAAVAVGDGAAKRRKVDLREPQSPQEWFDVADERLRSVRADEDPVLAVLVAAERAHLSALGDVEPLDLEARVAALLAALGTLAPDTADSPTSADLTDAWYASLRALTAAVVALEAGAPRSTESDSVPSAPLLRGDTFAELACPTPVLTWLRDVTLADELLARFGIAEDWIEAHYRAEADDDSEDGKEVAALPDEAASDVAVVQRLGRDAITSLRSTISLMPSEGAHPSARTAQYRKLEEALLLSSALIDPANDAALDKLEAEVERVRKEGGLSDALSEDAVEST
ncbi:hypothetical protein JCM3774_001099 [Rhodotorula dairenensis]